MKVSVKLASTRPLKKDLQKVKKREAQQLSGDLVEALTRHTPIDTGRARRGWKKSKLAGDNYVIKNTVKHTWYLEQGSSKQRPRGITKPALNELKSRGKLK